MVMSAEQSHLSTAPKRMLAKISRELIDKGFDQLLAYSDSRDRYGNFQTFEKVLKYFGFAAVEEDYQFFSKFIEINDELLSQIFETKDVSLFDKLILPMAQEYDVRYSVDGSCSFTEYYEDTVSCYDIDWVESMLETMQGATWDYYQGRLINTDYDNYDTADFNIDGVRPVVAESKSLLSRLVIENTADVVSSLDKRTLLELKRIIDSRLSSL
jgi:hypothetical protein